MPPPRCPHSLLLLSHITSCLLQGQGCTIRDSDFLANVTNVVAALLYIIGSIIGLQVHFGGWQQFLSSAAPNPEANPQSFVNGDMVYGNGTAPIAPPHPHQPLGASAPQALRDMSRLYIWADLIYLASAVFFTWSWYREMRKDMLETTVALKQMSSDNHDAASSQGAGSFATGAPPLVSRQAVPAKAAAGERQANTVSVLRSPIVANAEAALDLMIGEQPSAGGSARDASFTTPSGAGIAGRAAGFVSALARTVSRNSPLRPGDALAGTSSTQPLLTGLLTDAGVQPPPTGAPVASGFVGSIQLDDATVSGLVSGGSGNLNFDHAALAPPAPPPLPSAINAATGGALSQLHTLRARAAASNNSSAASSPLPRPPSAYASHRPRRQHRYRPRDDFLAQSHALLEPEDAGYNVWSPCLAVLAYVRALLHRWFGWFEHDVLLGSIPTGSAGPRDRVDSLEDLRDALFELYGTRSAPGAAAARQRHHAHRRHHRSREHQHQLSPPPAAAVPVNAASSEAAASASDAATGLPRTGGDAQIGATPLGLTERSRSGSGSSNGSSGYYSSHSSTRSPSPTSAGTTPVGSTVTAPTSPVYPPSVPQ